MLQHYHEVYFFNTLIPNLLGKAAPLNLSLEVERKWNIWIEHHYPKMLSNSNARERLHPVWASSSSHCLWWRRGTASRLTAAGTHPQHKGPQTPCLQESQNPYESRRLHWLVGSLGVFMPLWPLLPCSVFGHSNCSLSLLFNCLQVKKPCVLHLELEAGKAPCLPGP